jgi:hypothetical protein
MELQEKLRSIKMIQAESVTSYLSRFTQTHDELAVVGEIVDPTVLVRTTLNGFTKPNPGRILCKALWPKKLCPIGRGSGMTSCRRS